MKFGWINLFGAVIVVLMMIPNLIYAKKKAEEKPKKKESEAAVPKWLNICEQIGRYACVILMWLPLFVWKFGFSSPAGLLVYLLFNAMLLLYYFLAWIAYGREKSWKTARTLVFIPTAIFFVCGFLLHHWALCAAAVIFGLAHCQVTYLTHKDL